MAYIYLPYAITEAFCVVFTVAILFRLNESIASEHEVKQLRMIMYAYLGFLVTDIPWALNIDRIIVLDWFPNALMSAISIVSISLGCYFWFRYVEDRLHQDLPPSRMRNIAMAIPVMIVCTLDMVSIFTGWMFYIDADNNYQSTDLAFLIPTAVNYLYLLVPTVQAVWMARKSKLKAQRREYLSYLVLMIIPLICGMSEDLVPNVPILALCIFMVILLFFLTLQSRQVSTDALTGLNNRRWLYRFLEKRLASASTAEPVVLFMMDIDRFTMVNDAYGHIEGDDALRSFATALRLTAARYDAYIARWGGDEFCLIVNSFGRDPEDIEHDIDATLRTAQSVIRVETKPYTLSYRMGFAICDHPETRIDAFVERAIDVMSENKPTRPPSMAE